MSKKLNRERSRSRATLAALQRRIERLEMENGDLAAASLAAERRERQLRAENARLRLRAAELWGEEHDDPDRFGSLVQFQVRVAVSPAEMIRFRGERYDGFAAMMAARLTDDLIEAMKKHGGVLIDARRPSLIPREPR